MRVRKKEEVFFAPRNRAKGIKLEMNDIFVILDTARVRNLKKLERDDNIHITTRLQIEEDMSLQPNLYRMKFFNYTKSTTFEVIMSEQQANYLFDDCSVELGDQT